MLQKLKTMRKEWARQGLPQLHIGIGLNTGDAVVGNMGSRQRFAYTVIGDTVNLASRIESLTKQYGVALLCSEKTKRRVPFRKGVTFRMVDHVRVVGKADSVRLYEAMLHAPQQARRARMFAALYRAAFLAYARGNWKRARHLLFKIVKAKPHDKPATLLLERVNTFANTPPSDWNGVWTMHSK